jgi:hypothetical protein
MPSGNPVDVTDTSISKAVTIRVETSRISFSLSDRSNAAWRDGRGCLAGGKRLLERLLIADLVR